MKGYIPGSALLDLRHVKLEKTVEPLDELLSARFTVVSTSKRNCRNPDGGRTHRDSPILSDLSCVNTERDARGQRRKKPEKAKMQGYQEDANNPSDYRESRTARL